MRRRFPSRWKWFFPFRSEKWFHGWDATIGPIFAQALVQVITTTEDIMVTKFVLFGNLATIVAAILGN